MDARDASNPRLRRLAPDRYVDFTPVGQGGMGIVYWALDTELSRQIAFKVIRPPGTSGAEGVTPSAPLELRSPCGSALEGPSFQGLRRRFLQEAWVTGGMEHPGIVSVYELGETEGGVPYYTMRFVRGSRTLRTAIENLSGASFERRLDVLLEPFLKVCDTIRYAHSCGVIHRDLKPDNVALGEYGEVVVLDWGLAKVKGGIDQTEDPWTDRIQEMREDGDFQTVASVVGTPGYMSPEAARGDLDAIDEPSDVYALAVMLYQVLTGRLPFDFKSTHEYTERVLTREPPDPRAHEPDLPKALGELCNRALSIEPGDRPASADAFAAAIRRWRSEAARERDVHVLLDQARDALTVATTRTGEALLSALERATAACRRVLELEPGHAEASEHIERAHTLMEGGIRERERHARRHMGRRVGAIVLAVGLVAAVVVAGLLESRRKEAADARRVAEADRARAEGVMDFMVFELREGLEPIGRLDLLAQLGATARAYYTDLPREGLTRKSLIGHTVTLRLLGDVYEARGDLPAALEAYRLAGDVAKRILQADPEDALGCYHQSLADAKVGMALFRQGYASDAQRILHEHREDVLRLLQGRPKHAEYLDALASAHAAIGHVLLTQGGGAEARQASDDALAVYVSLEKTDPGAERWTRLRLRQQIDSVRWLRASARLDEAIEQARSTLGEIERRMQAGDRATDVRWMELAAAGRHALAVAYDSVRGGELAIFDAAYEAYAQLHALDPDNDQWRYRMAQTRIVHSRFYFSSGQPERGASLTAEALEIAKELTKKDPTNASWQNLLISLCDRMALHERNRTLGTHASLPYRTLAHKHARHLLALDPENAKWQHILAYTLSRLGGAYLGIDDEIAEEMLAGSIETAAPLVKARPTDFELIVLQSLSRRELGTLHLRTERREDGLAQWRRALGELNRCWAGGSAQCEVAGAIVHLHTLVLGELRRAGPHAQVALREQYRRAIEFYRRAPEEGAGWSAKEKAEIEIRFQRLSDEFAAWEREANRPK